MLEQRSLPIWIHKNNIVTETGKPYDLRSHLFMFDILTDWSQKQVWYKAAQVGGTLGAGLKSAYAVKNFGIDAIYTMPSKTDVRTLVGGKFNRMIQNNPALKEWVKDQDSVDQKQIGDNLIYYRGTWTEQQAISVTSDLNIHDEEDRSKQDVIDTYASRLDHSEYQWEWHFSNPSVPGNGVSKYWARSDQKEWFVACTKCKKQQYLKFPDNLCFERRVFQCKACHAELTNEDRRRGKWVQKYKDREFSGYHISQLMVTWKSAHDILRAYETKPRDYFYNFVLGLPYIGEGNTMNKDAMLQNCTDAVNGQENIVIGCDSGIVKHFVMGNKEGLFYHGKTEDWEDIARLLMRYKDAILIVDAMPDITGPRKLQERFPGRVYLCHYARDRKTMQLIRWGSGAEAKSVLADRNRMIQLVIDEFTDGRIPLQGTPSDWEPYYEHWETLYRITEVDSLGTPQIKWDTSNGNDHWCFTPDTQIVTQRATKRIDQVQIGDLVPTRDGWKPVQRAWMTQESARVMRVYLSNGRILKATPNHKVFADNQWRQVKDLKQSNHLLPWQTLKQLCSKELRSEDIPTQKQEASEFISLLLVRTGQEALVDCIKRFGDLRMGAFLKDLLFITRMEILSIMRLRIWKLYQELSINQNTIAKDYKTLNRKKETNSIFRKFAHSRMTGGKLTKVSNGTASTLSRLLCYQLRGSLFVLSAILRLLHAVEQAVSSVPLDVEVVTTQDFGEKSPVYNLTVQDKHEYIANGVLVANCHATIYWRIGMDKRGTGVADIIGIDPLRGIPESHEVRPDDTAIMKAPKILLPDNNYDWGDFS